MYVCVSVCERVRERLLYLWKKGEGNIHVCVCVYVCVCAFAIGISSSRRKKKRENEMFGTKEVCNPYYGCTSGGRVRRSIMSRRRCSMQYRECMKHREHSNTGCVCSVRVRRKALRFPCVSSRKERDHRVWSMLGIDIHEFCQHQYRLHVYDTEHFCPYISLSLSPKDFPHPAPISSLT